MKPSFTAFCLIAHEYWSSQVKTWIKMASEWLAENNEEKYVESVNLALDAAFRSGVWLNNWKSEMSH